METQKPNPYFGNTLKSQLPKDFVQLIDKVEQLTPEEREILQTAMIRSSEKHLQKIFIYLYCINDYILSQCTNSKR